jgi:hypothetical protein
MPVNPPNVNPTPRQRFQQDTRRVHNHRELASGDIFTLSADFAMLEYLRNQTAKVIDTQSAMAAGYRLQGAQDYLATFRALGESERLPTPVRSANLNPNA